MLVIVSLSSTNDSKNEIEELILGSTYMYIEKRREGKRGGRGREREKVERKRKERENERERGVEKDRI